MEAKKALHSVLLHLVSRMVTGCLEVLPRLSGGTACCVFAQKHLSSQVIPTLLAADLPCCRLRAYVNMEALRVMLAPHRCYSASA